MSELTHFNQAGEAHMVDIADKDQTHRIGIAEGWISMHPETFALVEKETREEGLSKIRLTVNKGNEHAIGVYSHYGFQVEEQVKSDIGSGYVMDDYVMVKEL